MLTYKLRSLFHLTTLICFLCWAIRFTVGRDGDVVASIVPIRSIYGTGKWYVRGANGDLPVHFHSPVYEVYIYGRKPILVETCFGRRSFSGQ